ncbi:hypothetical protein pipiens_007594 [Culex pipiens pipiens]|uniref:Peptidase S1 domain-containing protein n=1 Tax=Culex pipiens pipiens TaxID=38569 RepID=A0ABD1DKH8_CULPP
MAGNLSASGAAGTNTSSTVRRNVISVIPHEAYNATSGEHDIALLKLDRPLPLNNSSVQWIELQGPPPNVTSTGGQTTTASNKVNENCFINIYNNSVGPSNYPYTVVRNVSFFDKWVCDERNRGRVNGGGDGRCVEYRFGGSQSCLLDPDVLRHSEDRGTALVCNFKLAAILAEINPPVSAGQCVASMQRRTTAYYTPMEPHLGWIRGGHREFVGGGAASTVGTPSFGFNRWPGISAGICTGTRQPGVLLGDSAAGCTRKPPKIGSSGIILQWNRAESFSL